MAWKTDLELGQSYEDEAIRLLGGSGRTIKKAPKDKAFSDWDFCLDDESFEVKADRLAHRTGNLVIEHTCNGRPSGIRSTKAEWWCYFVLNPSGGYRYYKIPSSVIRKACVGAREWHTDNGRTKFYLVPVSQFSDYRVNVSPISDSSTPTLP